MSLKVDVCIAGIGLAIARDLARAGQEALLLKPERVIGSGTSSRNSEMIHASVFNPPDYIKARLCVV